MAGLSGGCGTSTWARESDPCPDKPEAAAAGHGRARANRTLWPPSSDWQRLLGRRSRLWREGQLR